MAGRRLLLADDSVTIRKVVELTFVDEGFDVTTTANGDQAIEMLAENLPDIVLADVYMPGLNGYQVCERIKRDERFRHIPVMLLVGSFEPFDEAEARRVGADDYLTKPFQSIRNLVSKVGSLLGADSSDDSTAGPETDRVETENQAAARARAAAKSQAGVMSADDIALTTADTAPLPHYSPDEINSRTFGKAAMPSQSSAHSGGPSVADVDTDETLEFETIRDRDANAEPVTEPDATSFDDAHNSFQNRETRGPRTSQEIHPPDYISQPQDAQRSENISAARNQFPASRLSNASAADEALLDLGEIETPAGATEADDFILDLQNGPAEQMPVAAPSHDEMDAAMRHETSAAMRDATDAVALADFQDRMMPSAPPSEEFVEAQESRESALTNSALHTGPITLEQLSPEVIDAIARRAVEHLSERVVEEIAWEVVPVLSELLIRRRLEEERSEAQ